VENESVKEQVVDWKVSEQCYLLEDMFVVVERLLVLPDLVVAAERQRRMGPVLFSMAVEGSLEEKMFVGMAVLVAAADQGCSVDEAEHQMVLHRVVDCCTHMKVVFESSKHRVDSHSHGKI
jgi:hypothetical protein